MDIQNQNENTNILSGSTPDTQPAGNLIYAGKPKRKLWKKILFWFGISVVSLIILFFTLPYILGLFFRDIPSVNDSDLNIIPAVVSDSDNAYFDYVKLGQPESIESKIVSNIGGINVSDFLNNSNWDQNFVDQILAKNQEALQIFDDSTKKPKFQDPKLKNPNWFRPESIFFSLGSVRSLSQIVSIQSADMLNKGLQKEALDKAFGIVDTGQKIQGSGMLINYLVGISIANTGLSRMERIAKSINLSPDELTTYENKLEIYKNNSEFLKNALKYEYVHMKNQIDNIGLPKEVEVPSYYRSSFYYQKNNTEQLFAETRRADIANVDKYCNQVKPVDIKDYAKGASFFSIYFTPNFVGKLMYNLAGVSLSSTCQKRCDENLSISRIELNLARNAYNQVNGTEPVSWDQLVPNYIPKIPIDPNTGEQMKVE